MRADLRDAFEAKSWTKGRDDVPRSGPGSNMAWTEGIRAALPRIFADRGIRTFLDAPCGDWFWMRHVDLSGVDYLGADISAAIVAENAEKFARDGVRFAHLDVTSDPLPKVDLMMCRDCLFHLQFPLRWAFFRNFLASGTSYLLTTINHVKVNRDLEANGKWRPFNPLLPPFSLPAPLELIHESDPDLPQDWEAILTLDKHHKHRSMGLWTRDHIAAALAAAPDPDPPET